MLWLTVTRKVRSQTDGLSVCPWAGAVSLGAHPPAIEMEAYHQIATVAACVEIRPGGLRLHRVGWMTVCGYRRG